MILRLSFRSNICPLALAILIVISSSCLGQTSSDYYFFPDSIETGDKVAQADQYYSFIGDYSRALAVIDANFNSEKLLFDSLIVHDLIHPLSLSTFLRSIPDTTKIVLFNEAHSYGVNRIAVKQALPILKKKGFDCLCMESYDWGDSSIGKYGFPTSATGMYVHEPNYAEMIRQAVKLGYRLFPIETTRRVAIHRDAEGSVVRLDSLTGDTLSIRLARNFIPYRSITYNDYRDRDMASNLMLAFKHGCRKVVDLSGHGHIYKGGSKYMGEILVDSFRVNPLSIDQVQMQEKRDTGSTIRLKQYWETNKISVPFNDGKPLSLANTVDAHIAFPSTKFLHNRPSWLTEVDTRKLFAVRMPSGLKYPVMIMAYYVSEYSVTKNAIPVDVFICSNPSEKAYTALYKHNNYVIRIIDSSRKESSYIKKIF